MNKTTTILMKGLLVFFCSFLFSGLSYAQSADLQILTTDGGYVETSQLSMSWTIGQISNSTEVEGALITTQGFQQSFPLLLSLPVEFLDFTATKQDKTVDLYWQTASERNNTGFEIERSEDGLSWEIIGFVEGHGNSNVYLDYDFVDLEPYPGNNYYRLKQIDWNGQFEFSPIRHVLFVENAAALLSVYPNPNSGQFTLSIYNPKSERAVIEVFSCNGELIWEKRFVKDEMTEYWKKEFDLNQWQMYYIVSRVGKKVANQKVVVINNQ